MITTGTFVFKGVCVCVCVRERERGREREGEREGEKEGREGRWEGRNKRERACRSLCVWLAGKGSRIGKRKV